MKRSDDGIIWVLTGVTGAVALGMLLIPLRGSASASNLAFFFLAFTILIAELGGRLAALFTAIISAVSLNFFLTTPYLTLTIDKRDDLLAFLALAVCGMIAAGFGRRRIRLSEKARRTSKDLDALQNLVDRLRKGESYEAMFRSLRESFRLGGLVLRNAKEEIIAASPTRASWAVPEVPLTPNSLFASHSPNLPMGKRGFRLPKNGGRISMGDGQETLFLDIWEGDTEGLTLDERQTLGVAAYLLMSQAAMRAS